MIRISDSYYCAHVQSEAEQIAVWDRQNPYRGRKGNREQLEAYWARRKDQRALFKKAGQEARAALKAAGLPTERNFQYEENAKKYAAEILRDYGIQLVVSEQADCFL